MLATAKMNSWVIDPASFVFSPAITYLSWFITAFLSGIWMAAQTTQTWWQARSLSTKQSMLVSLIAVIIAACMAAICIRAWVNPDQGYRNDVVPDFWVGLSTVGQSLKNPTEALNYPIQQRRPTRNRVHVFVAFDQEGYRYRVGMDSFAEVSLVSPRLIKEHWAMTNDPGVIMRGIGGGKEVHKQVTVPLRSQWGAPLDELERFAAEPPNGVDILMGLDIQEKLGAVIDRRAATVTMLKHKLEIRTAPSPEVTRRMNAEPVTVVATNAGCNFAYTAVRNAGLSLRVE